MAGGYFLVPFAGGEVHLPELSYGEARDWARASAAAFGPVFARFDADWKPGDGLIPIQESNELAMDATVDCIVAYDRTGVLGGRDAITGKGGLSTSKIHALYRQLYEEAHPFDADLQAALVQMATLRVNALLAAQLAGASSTNGSSPSGDSLQGKRTASSRRRNSNSSGTGPMNATAGKRPNGFARSTSA